MPFSPENCTYKMFDSDTGVFIKPNPAGEYDWPIDRMVDDKMIVNDWNTWARCFGYWLENKFGFDILSGDGSSFGIVGRRRNKSADNINWRLSGNSLYFEDFEDDGEDRFLPIRTSWMLPDNRNLQRDNDWSNDDYGLYPMESSEDVFNLWERYRAPSPFRPQQIDGTNYYTDGTIENGKLKWIGKWNNQKFDDENNRFDIILQNSNFGNLGIRIKYPLTTTTTRCYTSDYHSPWVYPDDRQEGSGTSSSHQAQYSVELQSDTTCFMSILPFLTASLNGQQIAKVTNCNRWLSNWSFSGYSTGILKYSIDDFMYIFLPQKYVGLDEEPGGNIYDANMNLYTFKKDGRCRWYDCSASTSTYDVVHEEATAPSNITTGYVSNLSGLYDPNRKNIFIESPGVEPFGWTKKTFEKFTNDMVPYLFENTGRNYNYIRYYTSYDNSVLYITVIDSNGNKGAELIFYKNEDETSGLLISEASPQIRNSSKSWYAKNGNKYWLYKEDVDKKYGNIGGLVASSTNSNGGIDNFEITPLKYYRDTRDVAIDDSGMWCLEKLCPMSNQETYCTNLYIVTRAGTNNFINEFKKITCTISGIKTNFIVFPFNNPTLQETNYNDSLTLLAIPIEQEV